MRNKSCITWMLGTAGLAAVSCTADIHGNTVNINASIMATTDIDTSQVKQGESIPVMVTVSNVFLIEPSQTPPPEHANDAGHIEVFLDDESSQPILVTAQVMFNVMVTERTPPGHHKLICRVHKHDGTPTTTKFELSFTVVVTAGGGGAPDAGPSVQDSGPSGQDAAPSANDAGQPFDGGGP